MYRVAAFFARQFLIIGNACTSRRFLWRFALVFIHARDQLSKYYQYTIPEMVTTRAGGRSFKLSGNPWNSMAGGIYWGGALGFEPLETKLVNSLCADYKVAFDIGANVGWFTLVMLSKNPALSVYAFEPQPTVRKILQSNLKLNNLMATVEDRAVSGKDGQAIFYITAEDCTSSLLESHESTETLTVRTVCIDSFVRQNEMVVDFIKIDVEGNELPALTGARRTLEEQSPDVLVEIQPKATNINVLRQILSQAGYTTAWTIQRNRWMEDPEFFLSKGHTVINYFISQKRQPPK